MAQDHLSTCEQSVGAWLGPVAERGGVENEGDLVDPCEGVVVEQVERWVMGDEQRRSMVGHRHRCRGVVGPVCICRQCALQWRP